MRPRIEQTSDGTLWLVIPLVPNELRVELSPEGLTGLASDIGAHFDRLKHDPEQMKKVGASFVNGLVDLFTKGIG